MSTQSPPPPPPPIAPAPISAKEAKAQAKAAKAYAKAQRPFWKKKRVLLPVALIALIVLIMAVSGGDDNKNNSTASTTASSGSTASGVSKGIGANDAAADVTVVKLGDVDVLGFRKAELKITNNSSKRSNYIIELSLESADGKTQLDTSTVTATNVDPGQSTGGNVLPFTKVKNAPADAVIKIKTVSRTAA